VRRITSAAGKVHKSKELIPRKLRLRRNQTSAQHHRSQIHPAVQRFLPHKRPAGPASTRRASPTYSSQRFPGQVRKSLYRRRFAGHLRKSSNAEYTPHSSTNSSAWVFSCSCSSHIRIAPLRHPYVKPSGSSEQKTNPSLPQRHFKKAPPVRKSPPAPASARTLGPRSGRRRQQREMRREQRQSRMQLPPEVLHETLPPDLSRRPPTQCRRFCISREKIIARSVVYNCFSHWTRESHCHLPAVNMSGRSAAW